MKILKIIYVNLFLNFFVTIYSFVEFYLKGNRLTNKVYGDNDANFKKKSPSFFLTENKNERSISK
jgi:hypothetical protein